MHKLVRLSLFTFLTFSAAVAHSENAQIAELKIGGLLHLTGEIAIQGEAFREGMELATNQINSDSSNTVKVKLFFEDTQYKPLESLTGVKRLILERKVEAVAISTVTEAKAAGPELQKHHLPGVVLWDSSPEIEAIGNYLFGIGPWTPASGESAAEFATKNLFGKKAVVVSSNTEWSSLVAQNFKKAFEAKGGTIISHIELNPQESDYRSLLQKIRSAAPDVLYGPIDSNIPTFFAQAKQIVPNIPLITSDVITDDYFVDNKTIYDGVFQTMTTTLDSAETKRMLAEYQSFFKRPCLQVNFVAWGYDAVMVLVKAALRQRESGTDLAEALRATKDYLGVSGNITFNERGSAPRVLTVYRVKDGKFELP